ncbi:hypothetical protein BT96DRAFT_776522, partial [Gymnopus androsaceus JB14]
SGGQPSGSELSSQNQTAVYSRGDDSNIELLETSTALNPEPSNKIILSQEQKHVLEKVKNKENVFFTGSAGTGKSVLLREIIRHLRESRREVAITASTG